MFRGGFAFATVRNALNRGARLLALSTSGAARETAGGGRRGGKGGFARARAFYGEPMPLRCRARGGGCAPGKRFRKRCRNVSMGDSGRAPQT